MKELRIEPKIENMDVASGFTEARLEEFGCPTAVTMKFLIALDEILNNIIHYSGAREAVIRVGEEGGYYLLEFSDDGVRFDPLLKKDPDITLDADDRQIGGLGIYMVKKSMDLVQYSYEDGKNVLKLGIRRKDDQTPAHSADGNSVHAGRKI